METRRQFLCSVLKVSAGAGVTLLLTPIIGACGSSSNGTSTTTNPTVPTCDGAGATSTVVLAHTHTVCVPLADLNNPPAAGQTYTTSGASTDGHTHQLTLTAAMLTEIMTGGTITVTTSETESHSHAFTLVENGQGAAAPAPTTTPAPAPTPVPTGGY